jgi:hypothetical protein
MLQGWRAESIANPGDFARHPWTVGMDTVGRGVGRGVCSDDALMGSGRRTFQKVSPRLRRVEQGTSNSFGRP